MVILGIETSTAVGSVALLESENGGILSQISVNIRAAHSEKLVPYINFALHEANLCKGDIDLIGVSIGPGSFTGLRVAISSAKGLALSLALPVVGVDSLMGCAFPYLSIQNKVAALFDAKRGEIFGAAYASNQNEIPEILIEPQIFKTDIFIDRCNELGISIYTGDVYKDKYARLLDENNVLPEKGFEKPNAISICKLGHIIYKITGEDNINNLSPRYLRDFIPGKPR